MQQPADQPALLGERLRALECVLDRRRLAEALDVPGMELAQVARGPLRPEMLLAYEINGQPLPPQHGFPLRLIVPGWYGMTHVKWLRSITAVAEPFTGWQQEVAYHVRQSEEEQGEPVTRIRPRSLLVPPGIPEFLSRTLSVDAQSVTRFCDVSVTRPYAVIGAANPDANAVVLAIRAAS